MKGINTLAPDAQPGQTSHPESITRRRYAASSGPYKRTAVTSWLRAIRVSRRTMTLLCSGGGTTVLASVYYSKEGVFKRGESTGEGVHGYWGGCLDGSTAIRQRPCFRIFEIPDRWFSIAFKEERVSMLPLINSVLHQVLKSSFSYSSGLFLEGVTF